MSKEEEMQPASNIRVNTHARGVVNAAAGQDTFYFVVGETA